MIASDGKSSNDDEQRLVGELSKGDLRSIALQTNWQNRHPNTQ